MNYVISQFIEGISLNPLESVLEEEDGDTKVFPSIKAAKDFILENNGREEDIGYAVFIGTKEKPDMVTYGSDSYQQQVDKQ